MTATATTTSVWARSGRGTDRANGGRAAGRRPSEHGEACGEFLGGVFAEVAAVSREAQPPRVAPMAMALAPGCADGAPEPTAPQLSAPRLMAPASAASGPAESEPAAPKPEVQEELTVPSWVSPRRHEALAEEDDDQPAAKARSKAARSPRRRAVIRRRIVAAVLLAVLAVGVGLWANRADATPTGHEADVVLVTVQPGQTLWHFASQLAKPGEDVRDVVAELRALNGMSGAQLSAGQRLALPRER